MRILVVDDQRSNANMLTELLKLHGDESIEAEDADTALAILQREAIQLVITDRKMPKTDGIELVKQIRRKIFDRYVYIIMLTAYDERETMLQSLEIGVDDYILRPIPPRELMARINVGKRIVGLETQLLQTIETQLKAVRQIEGVTREWVATVDAIPQLVCLLDQDGYLMQANKTVETWGLAWVHEIRGKTLPNLMETVYIDAARRLDVLWHREIHQKLAQGLEYRAEVRDEKTGHYFSVHFEPTDPFNEAQTAVSFAAVSIEDITERKVLANALEKSKAQSEELLFNILPEGIARRMRDGEENIAEVYENVTVLFADIVGFTRLTDSIDPHELVDMLNTIFSAFDQLAEQSQIEKIKTLGDGYLAVSGMPQAQADHADRMLQMASRMFNVICEINKSHGHKLALRVGIDSGSVIAGVIGKRKFAYDLWGSVVNTASRMESYGIAGHIQITETTYALLSDQALFSPRELVEVKGIGAVQSYVYAPLAVKDVDHADDI